MGVVQIQTAESYSVSKAIKSLKHTLDIVSPKGWNSIWATRLHGPCDWQVLKLIYLRSGGRRSLPNPINNVKLIKPWRQNVDWLLISFHYNYPKNTAPLLELKRSDTGQYWSLPKRKIIYSNVANFYFYFPPAEKGINHRQTAKVIKTSKLSTFGQWVFQDSKTLGFQFLSG